jgi:hypothetical protein
VKSTSHRLTSTSVIVVDVRSRGRHMRARGRNTNIPGPGWSMVHSTKKSGVSIAQLDKQR